MLQTQNPKLEKEDRDGGIIRMTEVQYEVMR